MSRKEEPTDREKADLIRDKLMRWTGILMENAEEVHLVMRTNGKDVRYEFDWVKELLK